MKKIDVLKQLIDCLYAPDNPERDNGEYSMHDFLGYMNSRTERGSPSVRSVHGGKTGEVIDQWSNTESDISIMLVLMYRYARGYVKKVLKNSILQTADEFSFLMTLMTNDSLTKTDLINRQVMEKTSGTDVIKRLLKYGQITEFRDETDGRSLRVAITDKGRQTIISILPEMSVISKIIAGNLTPEEINTFAYLLRKLDNFHNDIFMNMRKASIPEISKLI